VSPQLHWSFTGGVVGYLILLSQFGGALFLFFTMNWLGRHATDLGYQSITLFEQKSESIALNFLLRAVSPTIFIILISAISTQIGIGYYTRYTFGIILIYYVIRIIYIFLWSKQGIVNWIKIFIQYLSGIFIGWWAFEALILPRKNILPDASDIGNELWVMIALFLYAVVNKIETSSAPSIRRKNKYIDKIYKQIVDKFGHIVSSENDRLVQLTAYAILIFENYNRPPLIRNFERILFPVFSKTLGIMQVSTDHVINDAESVSIGLLRIQKTKSDIFSKEEKITAPSLVRGILKDHNKDDYYIDNVMEVMRIIAKRIDFSFEDSWSLVEEYETIREAKKIKRKL
jgi:hypothetical protein